MGVLMSKKSEVKKTATEQQRIVRSGSQINNASNTLVQQQSPGTQEHGPSLNVINKASTEEVSEDLPSSDPSSAKRGGINKVSADSPSQLHTDADVALPSAAAPATTQPQTAEPTAAWDQDTLAAAEALGLDPATDGGLLWIAERFARTAVAPPWVVYVDQARTRESLRFPCHRHRNHCRHGVATSAATPPAVGAAAAAAIATILCPVSSSQPPAACGCGGPPTATAERKPSRAHAPAAHVAAP